LQVKAFDNNNPGFGQRAVGQRFRIGKHLHRQIIDRSSTVKALSIMRHYLSFDFNFVKRFSILSITKSVSTTEKTRRRDPVRPGYPTA
jgi:hypothetical protein